MTSVKQKINSVNYENIINELKAYLEEQTTKKREKAYRMDLAKRWVSLGMDPSQVQAMLGITLSNVMNMYKLFPKQAFEEDTNEIYKKSIEEVKKLYTTTLNYIEKTIDINFNKNDFKNNLLNKNGIKKVTSLYKNLKKNNKTLEVNLLQDFMAQVTILKTDNMLSTIENNIRNNGKENIDTLLNKNEEFKDTMDSLELLSSFKEKQENFVPKALISTSIKNKYGNTVIYNSLLMSNNIKPTPFVKKRIKDKEEEKKENLNKLMP